MIWLRPEPFSKFVSFLQLSRNLRSHQPWGDFTKSLTTVEEESVEHRSTLQEDPFKTGDFRGRSRSAAVTKEPKELLGITNGGKGLLLNQNLATEDSSSASLFSLDKCSNLMDDDFDLVDDESYEILFGDEDEGDSSIYFGESVMMANGSCSTNQSTSATNDGCSCPKEPDLAKLLVQFPISSSAQLQAFHSRLEHLILNVPDFPPARTFVE